MTLWRNITRYLLLIYLRKFQRHTWTYSKESQVLPSRWTDGSRGSSWLKWGATEEKIPHKTRGRGEYYWEADYRNFFSLSFRANPPRRRSREIFSRHSCDSFSEAAKLRRAKGRNPESRNARFRNTYAMTGTTAIPSNILLTPRPSYRYRPLRCGTRRTYRFTLSTSSTPPLVRTGLPRNHWLSEASTASRHSLATDGTIDPLRFRSFHAREERSPFSIQKQEYLMGSMSRENPPRKWKLRADEWYWWIER